MEKKGEDEVNFSKITIRDVTIPCLTYIDCIAKSQQNNTPGITVAEHCANAANVADNLSSYFSSMDFLKKWGVILAAVHDAGKISPGFQKKYFNNYLQKKCPVLARIQSGNFCGNHAEISEAAVRDLLDEILDDSASGEIVGVHHGWRNAPKQNNSGVYGGENWAEERLGFLKEMRDEYGDFPDKTQLSAVEKSILAGFITISDWVASDENFFPADCFSESQSCIQAAKAIDSCGFRKINVKPDLSFEDIFTFSPRESQISLIKSINSPGVYILEAETGSGKTEAALYSAYKMLERGFNNGVYFALPTKLTSDRIHSRVQKFVDKISETRNPVMLSHASAWLNDEAKIINSGGEELAAGGSWFNPSKRTLLAPFGVGTVDQALMSVMNVKHYFVRTFGLAGKVVILDEVHSYDIYTGTILDKLVEALREMGCTVIILSATLTKERKKTFFNNDLPENDNYPLITSHTDNIIKTLNAKFSAGKNINIEFEYASSLEQTAETAIKKANNGECVLWINNTVAAAQNAYKHVEAVKCEGAFDIGLLHSRYTVNKRREIEKEWMGKLGQGSEKRPKGCILIATQVVEQSVDIDADFLITELAPIDMLIQRFGRLWRHERPARSAKKPNVLIITGRIGDADSLETLIDAIGKNNSMIYAPYVLWRTWDILKDKSNIVIPSELRELLEGTYRINKNEPLFIRDLFEKMKTRADKLKRMAGGALAGVMMPTLNDDENRPPTRYCELPSVDCLLVKDIDLVGDYADITLLDGQTLRANQYEKDFSMTKQLHGNIVSIARYNFNNMDLKVPSYLKKHFFGELAVLLVADDCNLSIDGNPTKLFYREDLGVYREKDFKREKIIDNNNFNTKEWDYESCDW